MITSFLIWLGWYSDPSITPGAVSFWSLPLGLACSGVIAVYSYIRVICPHYKADWLDSVYNMLNALLFTVAFFGGLMNDFPAYIVKTWLIIYATRCLFRGLVDWLTKNKKAR